MKRSILFKATTLLFFTSLISIFLLYQTGNLATYFSGQDKEESVQTSPNGGVINSLQNDTIPTPYTDSLQKLRISSSKSVIITYDTSLLKKAIEEQRRITPKKDKERLSSSKSLIIVKPVDYSKFDTNKQDIKQLKRRNN
jgi:hypothetical protein